MGRSQIAEAVRLRPQTDRVLPLAWVVLPVVSAIVPLVGMLYLFLTMPLTIDPTTSEIVWEDGGFWGWFTVTVLVSLVSSIFFAILIYKLITRRNQHFKREALLRAGILQYLRERASVAGGEHTIASELATMRLAHSDANANDDEKNAVLWTILRLVPFVGAFAELYVLYFLTKYPHEHGQRWLAFMQQAQSAGSKLGVTVVVPAWKTVPRRSFALYFLLVLLTAGLFQIYWYYALLEDPNEHFKVHWEFEDQLVAAAT